MLEIYRTENENLYGKLRAVLSRRGFGEARIMHNANGKPYLEGNPLFFSLSHSGSTALIAVCDSPVGIDFELKRDKKFTSVLSRFPDAEKKEIPVPDKRHSRPLLPRSQALLPARATAP